MILFESVSNQMLRAVIKRVIKQAGIKKFIYSNVRNPELLNIVAKDKPKNIASTFIKSSEGVVNFISYVWLQAGGNLSRIDTQAIYDAIYVVADDLIEYKS